MLLLLCTSQWVLLMTLFASEVQNHGGDFLKDGGNIMMMIGSALIVMIGVFEMDRFDIGSQILHTLGAVVSVFVIEIAVFLQCESIHSQDEENLGVIWVSPIFLLVISVFFIGSFCFLATPRNCEQFEKDLIVHIKNGGSLEEYMKEARPKINRLSLQILVSECTFIYCTLLAMALYLSNWGMVQRCDFGCRNKCYGCC